MNQYAAINFDKLAFNRIIEEPTLITIPIKGKKDTIICANSQNERALLKIKVPGGWTYSELDPDTISKIYQKIREVQA